MRRLFRLLLPLALLAPLPVACSGFVREQLYLPDATPIRAADWTRTPPAELSVPTGDGLALQGFYWPGDPADPDVILFFHGRGNGQGEGARRAESMVGGGDSVMVASYRGFGANPGRPTQANMVADARAFIANARALKGPRARIWLVGHSLGAGVALAAAAEEEVAGVIAISAFARLGDVAPSYARPLLPDRWDNRATLAHVVEPVVLVHGDLDGIVPITQAEALLARARPGTPLVVMPGIRHRPDMEAVGPFVTSTIAALAEGGRPLLPKGWTVTVAPAR